MNIFQFRRNLREVRDNLEETIQTVIASPESQDLIVELQKEQLLQGENIYGDKIMPDYANKYYAQRKHNMNKFAGYGTPDLKLTGDFHRAIYFNVDKMLPTSDDPKLQWLGKRYEDIFGLNEECLQIYRPEFKQKFIGKIKAQLSEE